MPNSYSHLLLPVLKCSESHTPYGWLTERHIQAMWLDQKYFKNLTTIHNEKVEVISPGIWNAEAGPDFLKAHIKIGKDELKGDIEIHLYEEGWVRHSHHTDERYNSVILHIVFWQSKHITSIHTKFGTPVAQVYLEPFLTLPIARLLHLIDIDLYPYEKFAGTGRCANQLFGKLEGDRIAVLLASASYWRLEQKKEYLQQRAKEEWLQLGMGLAMALGYKHNAESFLELFLFLIPYRDLPENELFAISLGVCGFFDRKIPADWSKSDYYQLLKIIWEGVYRAHMTYQCSIRLDKIRPYNHPVRRLVYLVNLLKDPELELLWDKIRNTFNHGIDLVIRKPSLSSELIEELIKCIPSYRDDFWNHRYTFGTEKDVKYISLLGEDVKIKMVLNTLFPLLHHEIKKNGNPTLWNGFQIVYGKIRAPSASKKKYLTYRFFGNTMKGKVLGKAQMEQGAYQIHKDFCIHYESSCEGCPFSERYLRTCPKT